MKKKLINSLIPLAMAAAVCVPTVLPNTTANVPILSDVSVVQMIDADAASYKTGKYKVNDSSGVNVRSGAGTGYSKLGAAKNGTQFTVTKISGNWGYASIKCTNGTQKGWICLTYCKYIDNEPLENNASYFISPACATGSVLDTYHKGKSNGTNIHLWSKHSDTDQQFKAVLKSNGYYAFYNVNAGNKVLDVKGGKVGNGVNVQLYDYNGTDAQLWKLIDAGNGYYYLQSKLNSSYYLDVTGAKSNNGTNIELYKGNNSNAQKFKFTKVQNSSNNSSSSNGKVSLNVPYYSQGDSRWKNVALGNTTMGKAGCIVTSVAMAYSYNQNKTFYPNTVKSKLSFTKSGDIYWSSVSNCGMKSYSKGGASINQNIMSEIYNKLKSGKPVVMWCTNSSGRAHAVCITGYSGSTSTFSASNFTINDPGYSRTNLQQHLNYVNKIQYLIY